MGALAQTDYWMWLYLLDLTCISWFSESSTEKSGVFSWHASKSEKVGITIFVTSIFLSSSPESSWVSVAFQPQALETASSKASSVLLPPAEDLAVSYPLEVLVFVGQDTVFFFRSQKLEVHSKWRLLGHNPELGSLRHGKTILYSYTKHIRILLKMVCHQPIITTNQPLID